MKVDLRKGSLLLIFLLVLVIAVWPTLAQGPVRSPDIVGGEEASPGAWPWQVALVAGGATDLLNAQSCGGSLIDEEWVLTASHCVEGSLPDAIDVVAGVHDLANPEAGYQQRSVTQIIMHPGYDPGTVDNDMALLKLSTPVQLGQTTGGITVSLISLVAADVGSLDGITATVTGWGNRSDSGSDFPERLHQVSVPIISNEQCQNLLGITDNMMCAGYTAGGKDSCQGDSGGPLVIFDVANQRWQQAGVVSWGIGCAQPDSPGVYARVSRYIDWIKEQGVELPTGGGTGGTGTLGDNLIYLPFVLK